MGEQTGISWADHTFNPWHGCTKVSPGCDFCYAEAVDANPRFNIVGQPHWGKEAPRRFFSDSHWRQLKTWNNKAALANERRRAFCGSMCDIMEDRRDLDQHRTRLYDQVEATPWIDYLFLTKRAHNYKRLLPKDWLINPRPHVWLGTTVESPKYINRADELRDLNCAVRWLSMEPLLEEFSEEQWLAVLHRIDWAIFGGESGKNARTTRMAWIAAGIKAAMETGTMPFMKQTGSKMAPEDRRLFEIGSGVRMTHKAGAKPAEWPARFRYQEFPTPRRFTTA